MTNTQDLSLLTDEERVLWDFCSSRPKEQAVIIPAEMLDVLTSLIAARAENEQAQLELDTFSRLVCDLTMSRLSKTNYTLDVYLGEIEEVQNKIINESIAEAKEEWAAEREVLLAENKRKDELLGKAEETLIWTGGAFQSADESAAFQKQVRPVLNEIRALLQPKKEGE